MIHIYLCLFVIRCYRNVALSKTEFPPQMSSRILPLLFSLQDTSQLSSLPTFPSAAMQCQRWLQAQTLAQTLTLLALGRSLKTFGPSLVAAAVWLHVRGEKAELEMQGRLRAHLLYMSTELLKGQVRKSQICRSSVVLGSLSM